MSQTLPVVPSQLPAGACPADYQAMLNLFSAHQSVLIPDSAVGGISVSASKPADQTRPWLQLDAFGRPIRIYQFAQGSWLSLHPLVSGLTQWWFDVLPNFTTFDGGDANPISALSGPMWQQAKNSNGVLIAAQFPVAAGTLPSTAILAQGAVGGEEKHVLTATEANHFHGFGDGTTGGIDGSFCIRPWSAAVVGTGTHQIDTTVNPQVGPAISGGRLGTSDSVPSDVLSDGHNCMPPFVVGYLLQRTTRLYFSIV